MLLRVAAYCRVSTDWEDQANSLTSQKQIFPPLLVFRQDPLRRLRFPVCPQNHPSP